MISVSIVSHGQGGMVDHLLADLDQVAATSSIEIIVTENIADHHRLTRVPTTCPVRIIRNNRPLGFGANHNQALAAASGTAFCILNPDIRLVGDPFPLLLDELEGSGAGAVAPAIVAPNGAIEDSARRFPTPWSLAARRLGVANDVYHYDLGHPPMSVDWLAGMFILFDAAVFRAVGGFDEAFFLYCEDIDISARIWRTGHPVRVCPQVSAVHDGQRASHRNLKYLRWHVMSMARYFAKHAFRPRPATAS